MKETGRVFLASFLVLFWELVFIRWLPAYIPLFSFFSNFILIAAFAGTGLGCILRGESAPRRIPVSLLLIALGSFVLVWSLGAKKFAIASGSAQSEVFFGIGTSGAWYQKFEWILVPYCVVLVIFFSGLGRALGSAMEGKPPLPAYAANLAGSIAGVASFALFSGLGIPAPAWWAAGSVGLALLDKRKAAVPVFLLAVAVAWGTDQPLPLPWKSEIQWSPYYRILFWKDFGHLSVNGIGHQNLHPVEEDPGSGVTYEFPMRLARAARGEMGPTLVIGAGTGNDCAFALANGASSVDAVEIDPTIHRLGVAHHPDRPYADPRLRIVINDGRAVLRHPPQKYGTVLYAVVDSLTLLSSYGKARLETYLFSVEAFRDVKATLAPDGVFIVYNDYREPWIEAKLHGMLTEAFGKPPLVFTRHLRPLDDTTLPNGATSFFVAGHTEPLEALFPEGQAISETQLASSRVNFAEFGIGRARPNWSRIPAPATDDWPFFYLRERRIPAHNFRGLAVVLGVAILFWLGTGEARFAPGAAPMLFLGAGFLLLETVAVARVALLVGSTWWTNAAVFLTILLLAAAGNLIVMKRPIPPEVSFGGLFLSLLALYLIPSSAFLGLPGGTIAAALVYATPCLFAAIVFSSLFARSAAPQVHLGWNMIGAVLGGSLEYLGLIVGYRALLLLAIVLYAAAGLTSRVKDGFNTTS